MSIRIHFNLVSILMRALFSIFLVLTSLGALSMEQREDAVAARPLGSPSAGWTERQTSTFLLKASFQALNLDTKEAALSTLVDIAQRSPFHELRRQAANLCYANGVMGSSTLKFFEQLGILRDQTLPLNQREGAVWNILALDASEHKVYGHLMVMEDPSLFQDLQGLPARGPMEPGLRKRVHGVLRDRASDLYLDIPEEKQKKLSDSLLGLIALLVSHPQAQWEDFITQNLEQSFFSEIFDRVEDPETREMALLRVAHRAKCSPSVNMLSRSAEYHCRYGTPEQQALGQPVLAGIIQDEGLAINQRENAVWGMLHSQSLLHRLEAHLLVVTLPGLFPALDQQGLLRMDNTEQLLLDRVHDALAHHSHFLDMALNLTAGQMDPQLLWMISDLMAHPNDPWDPIIGQMMSVNPPPRRTH